MAFYLIILIGILLILFNYNAVQKEKKSFKNVLTHEVNYMDEFNAIIFDIQKQIEDINIKFDIILEINKKNDGILGEKVEIYDKMEDNKGIINTKTIDLSDNSSNNIKINEIKDLLKQGLSIEDIAGKLNIGKGEVLLIKELYLK